MSEKSATASQVPLSSDPGSHTLGRQRAAIVLIGSPGSGKTTLARALAERRPIAIIEVGSLLKQEVQQETALGKRIAPFTAAGELVPFEMVNEVLSRALQATPDDLVLFDGIPRSTAQIRPFFDLLAGHRLDLCAVIVLTLQMQTALDRLVGRRVCSQCGALYNLAAPSLQNVDTCERCGGALIQRRDDSEEIVRRRFERFDRETVPVINFFHQEFAALTWEQSATTPLPQRVSRVWDRLQKALPSPIVAGRVNR